MNDLVINPNNPLAIPDYLQGVTTGVTEGLMAAVALGGSRIGLKGGRFRIVVNGKEEGIIQENYLDVVILAAYPAVSRLYYESQYDADSKAAPSCYSADGVSPAADVKHKQADKCATCPQNVLGSKIANGNKSKACSYFRRLVVMLAGDTEGRAFRVDVKGMGVFGESYPKTHMYNLTDYAKFIAARNVDLGTVVTRLTFDTEQSVPKLLFSPNRYVTMQELEVVRSRVHAEDVKQMVDVNMTTVDLSGEVDSEPTPAPAPVQAAPAPAPQATARQVVQPVQQTSAVQQAPVKQVVQSAAQAPVKQVVQPVAQAPVKQQVVAPVHNIPPPTAPAPAAVTEVTSDAQLEALLNSLDN